MLILETIPMNNPLRDTLRRGGEAVLLRNRRTELTEERTVEYVI
mgnify:CR=1 FL=1